jgi:hypothetical protein
MALQNQTFSNFSQLPTRKINLSLLTAHKNYFDYSEDLLRWLGEEVYLHQSKKTQNPFPKPKQLAPPALYIP